jgi:predicted metal-dependent peptidase
MTLVSFDAECYEAVLGSCTLKGGGGTRAQAVEEFIQKRHQPYPDVVFLLTDGWTPPASPRHPDRWIWRLPRWGSTQAVPKGSRSEFFEFSEPQTVS